MPDTGGPCTPARDSAQDEHGVVVSLQVRAHRLPQAGCQSVLRRTVWVQFRGLSCCGAGGSQGAPQQRPRRAQLSGSIAGPRGRAQAAPEGVPPTEAHLGAESVVGGNAWDESYEPWCDPRFSDHGRGRDSWCLALWERGWLMRLRPKARKNPFSPVQRTLPCLPEQLNGDRATLIQHFSGDLEIISDEWQDPRPWTRSSEWKGVTYFRRARPERSNEDIAVIDGYEVIR